jgi:hypothetical protein
MWAGHTKRVVIVTRIIDSQDPLNGGPILTQPPHPPFAVTATATATFASHPFHRIHTDIWIVEITTKSLRYLPDAPHLPLRNTKKCRENMRSDHAKTFPLFSVATVVLDTVPTLALLHAHYIRIGGLVLTPLHEQMAMVKISALLGT